MKIAPRKNNCMDLVKVLLSSCEPSFKNDFYFWKLQGHGVDFLIGIILTVFLGCLLIDTSILYEMLNKVKAKNSDLSLKKDS